MSKLFPKTVRLMEVGPRDGLQNESQILDTASKIELINALSLTGLKRIEVTAFVSSKWIPALADHTEVLLGIHRNEGVSYAALVPNLHGYEAAMKAQADEISFVLSVSNTHNKKNINATTKEAFLRYEEVSKKAYADGIPFRFYVSCSFGCPYEGEIKPQVVSEWVKRLYDLGPYEIALGDTLGIANPKQTAILLDEVLKICPLSHLALHMHDTYGRALSNIYVALTYGVGAFDASCGGLGGCPYAKGAAGNVATEDLIDMLHSMEIETGVSLNKIVPISKRMEQKLNRTLPSKLLHIE